jgi:hypothetical protein
VAGRGAAPGEATPRSRTLSTLRGGLRVGVDIIPPRVAPAPPLGLLLVGRRRLAASRRVTTLVVAFATVGRLAATSTR